jgi:hypothetical protein
VSVYRIYTQENTNQAGAGTNSISLGDCGFTATPATGPPRPADDPH